MSVVTLELTKKPGSGLGMALAASGMGVKIKGVTAGKRCAHTNSHILIAAIFSCCTLRERGKSEGERGTRVCVRVCVSVHVCLCMGSCVCA